MFLKGGSSGHQEEGTEGTRVPCPGGLVQSLHLHTGGRVQGGDAFGHGRKDLYLALLFNNVIVISTGNSK